LTAQNTGRSWVIVESNHVFLMGGRVEGTGDKRVITDGLSVRMCRKLWLPGLSVVQTFHAGPSPSFTVGDWTSTEPESGTMASVGGKVM
jgi:hypothetical protein